MSFEEGVDYGKTLFEELKFVEMIVSFCKTDEGAEAAEGEQEYTSYLS